MEINDADVTVILIIATTLIFAIIICSAIKIRKEEAFLDFQGFKLEEEKKIEAEKLEDRIKGVMKKWVEITQKYPGSTQEELREIYINQYPTDKDLDLYLKEREKERDNVEIEKKESSYIKGIHDILLIFLLIFIVLLVVSCLGTCI